MAKKNESETTKTIMGFVELAAGIGLGFGVAWSGDRIIRGKPQNGEAYTTQELEAKKLLPAIPGATTTIVGPVAGAMMDNHKVFFNSLGAGSGLYTLISGASYMKAKSINQARAQGQTAQVAGATGTSVPSLSGPPRQEQAKQALAEQLEYAKTVV